MPAHIVVPSARSRSSPRHGVRPLRVLIVALVVAVALIGALVLAPRPAQGEGQVRITGGSATCGDGALVGSFTISNGADQARLARVVIALQFLEGGTWYGTGNTAGTYTVEVPANQGLSISYGPYPYAGVSSSATGVRAVAQLSTLPTEGDPGEVNSDSLATASACNPNPPTPAPTAAPAPPVATTGGVEVLAPQAVCDGVAFLGEAPVFNTSNAPAPVKLTLWASAYSGGWVRLAAPAKLFSSTIDPFVRTVVPFNFPLAGAWSDSTAVRLEGEISYTEFIAGQPLKRTTAIDPTEIACLRPTPGAVAGGKYTVVLGDTLDAVAARVGLAPEQILAANPTSDPGGRLKVGQQLTLSAGATPTAGKTTVIAPRPSVVPNQPEPNTTVSPRSTPTPPPPKTEAPTKETQSPTPKGGAAAGTSVTPRTSTTPGPEGPGGGKPAEGAKSGGGLVGMLLPIGLGLGGLIVLAGLGFGGFLLFKRLGSRPPRAEAPAQVARAVATVAAPAAPVAPPAPPPAIEKAHGTPENPAGIPLTGDIEGLFGLNVRRTRMAETFVPNPADVQPTPTILGDARELLQQMKAA